MDKKQARKLVKETLQSTFDKERYVKLVKNILNHIKDGDDDVFCYQGNYIFDDFKDSIQCVERVGKYTDPDGNHIDILIVQLAKDTSLERARTKQRNYVAKYLKGSRGGVLKDAALVAFVAPNDEDWRFSLVKIEYQFDNQGKVKEEFTPARRYSFLVGKNEASHTAQSRFLPVLCNDKVNPTLVELEDIFSVEKATEEFFQKYRDLFLKLKEALDEIVKTDAKVATDFKEKNIDTADFAKKLLGQLVFLYFLQKKGWFGVARDKKWGDGSKRFLRDLFDKWHKNVNNFFNDILEALFYEALRQDREDDYYSRFDCRIPFLNGGLFDPLNGYDWIHTDILIPNEIFSNQHKTKEGDEGDGILDIFDRYNFTVKEDEPLEKEVAIDPEMLGKVFENLLNITDRKSKGTYYTPREIVHYMCQESLANYLVTELDGKTTKEEIETFIKYGETVVEHNKRVVSEERETERYPFKLPKNVRHHAALIDEKLASICVCDPAVGSGAFPVGMMNEIIRSRNALTPHIVKDSSRTSYHFKRHAIQNCLYGVDIDPSAVEIAKLRLWLSLIVDEEERETIKPLPNLDYKIVQGNSLLGYPFETGGTNEIAALQKEYFSSTRPCDKKQLKSDINLKIEGILSTSEKSLGYKVDFDFKIFFSEVFHKKQGFDVVIGNPPYLSAVQSSKNDTFIRKIYKQNYPLIKGAFDIYIVFLIKGIQITNKIGSYAWIVPNKLLVSQYAENVLKYLKNKGFYQVISVSSIKVFEASVYPIIILGNKLFHDFNKYEVDQLEDLETNNIKKQFVVDKNYKTFRENGVKISSGATGFQAKQLIKYLSEHSTKYSLPFVVSGSIDPYIIHYENVRYMKKVYCKAFITKGAEIAESKWKFWQQEKIIIAGMTKRLEATYSENPLAIGVGTYAIHNYSNYSSKFLLGLLNSKFMTFYVRTKFKEKHLAGGYMAINKSIIEKLPIIDVIHKNQEPFITLVDKILAITKTDDYLENSDKKAKVHEYEKQIDQLVYKLYGLTAGEIKIVEKENS